MSSEKQDATTADAPSAATDAAKEVSCKNGAKAAGTGVFMPMVSRTSFDPTGPPRSKPGRRRNVSTGSLGHHAHAAPSRSVSSRELGRPHQGVGSRDVLYNTSITEEDSQVDYSPIADVHALHAAANLTASAFTPAHHNDVAVSLVHAAPNGMRMQQNHSGGLSASPPGLLQVNRSGSNDSTTPKACSAGAPALSPNTADANALNSLLQPPPIRVSPTATAPDVASVMAGRQINSEVLQTFFGPASSSLKAASFYGPDLVAGAAAPGLNSSAAPDRAAAAGGMLQPSASANVPPPSLSSLPQGNSKSPLPSPRTLAAAAAPPSSQKILGQPSFSKWAVDGMTALPPKVELGSPDNDSLEEHEEQIQKRIDELMMMKQLLQLKQQHKQQQDMLQQQQREQQQLLQMQQLQQEQMLQHQLLHVQRSEGSASSSKGMQPPFTNMQQELMLQQQQLLQVQRSDSSSGRNGMQQLQQEFLMQQQQHMLSVQHSDNSGTSMGRGGQLQQMAQLQQDLLMQLQLQQAGTADLSGPIGSVDTATQAMLSLVPSAGNLAALLGPAAQHSVGLLSTNAAGGPGLGNMMSSTTGMSAFAVAAANNSCDLPLTPALHDDLVASASLGLASLQPGMVKPGGGVLGPWGSSVSSSNNNFLFGDGSLGMQPSVGVAPGGQPHRASMDLTGSYSHMPPGHRSSFEVNSRVSADFSSFQGS